MIAEDALLGLIDGYDGRNRYYLEALGVAFHGKEKEVYEQLIRPLFPNPKSGNGRQRTWPGACIRLSPSETWIFASGLRSLPWTNSGF